MKLSEVQTMEDYNQMYAERGVKISAKMAELKERGEVTGTIPTGYQKVFKNGRKAVEADPEKAPLVFELFSLAASGKYSIVKIADALYEKGLTSRTGKSLSSATIHGMIHNPVYMTGLAGAEGLVSAELFYKAQGAIGARRR
ncbi:recombinase family protein [Armatimonas sp.]|uniref:recombinase family protein n=1 Tax=Armatimonas sp. TaxID=1872638 RepID=UPI00286B3F98|nr:recombinase family protein [Armatimonas sp.]